MEEEQSCNCEAGAPGWLATFADLMSLLLTFFILIVSFSSIQQVEFQKAMGSLKGALGILKSKRALMSLSTVKNPEIQFHKLSMVWEKVPEIMNLLKKMDMEDGVKVESLPDAVKFTFDDNLLFDSGRARLKPKLFPVLRKIVEMVKEFNGTILIEGHTDNIPIRTPRYPSNWELSAARAINVLHYFENMGVKRENLACIGYADTKPLVPNTTPENRAKNRRVELYVKFKDNEKIMRLNLNKIDQLQYMLPDSKSTKDSKTGEKNGR
ncbi:MAG TPA: flagellar motor protein MotB [Bacteroidetes bacterium]|nr:flagellar motor protein MotB [Bacteroidota bacterium]